MVDRFKSLTKNKKVLLVFVTILALVLFLIYKNNFLIKPTQPQPIGEIDENATELVEEVEKSNQNNIYIPGYPNEIYLTEKQTETAIQLVNPEGNSVYFVFTLSIGEKEGQTFKESEVLYESGLVEPAQVIKQQKLTRTLTKGVYDASISIKTYDIETEQEMNGARTMTKLIVE